MADHEEVTVETHVVDVAAQPWREGETEGLTFEAQVLLDGAGGGPEALRFRFDPCPSVYAHMHLTSQYQLVLGGEMDMPRGRLRLGRHDLHYTDHNVPYGPFSVTAGHDMLVLHPQPGGLISMEDLRARRAINLDGRLIVGFPAQQPWRPTGDGTAVKHLIPADPGPPANLVRLPAGVHLAAGPAPDGRYEVVLEGSLVIAGVELGPPGLRFVRGDGEPEPAVAGASGATVAVLTFDRDAREGGLSDEGIAAAAAEALARAI
jgi:hypothetical protein